MLPIGRGVAAGHIRPMRAPAFRSSGPKSYYATADGPTAMAGQIDRNPHHIATFPQLAGRDALHIGQAITAPARNPSRRSPPVSRRAKGYSP
jgi:hypothetical protein